MALPEGGLVVNSSQGGGSKDTWVTARRPPIRPHPGGPDRDRSAADRRRLHPDGSRAPSRTPARTGPRARGSHAASSSTATAAAAAAASERPRNGAAGRGGAASVLSRIAESLFWIGRYVERAEDTARILDVHIHHLLEAPASSETETCQVLLDVMGVPRRPHRPGCAGADAESRVTATAPTAGWSRRCWRSAPTTRAPSCPRSRPPAPTPGASARPSAPRCGRPSIPPTTPCPARWALARRIGPHGFFRFVRERAAVVAGLTDSTMSRDDAWRFLVLGRSLERVDMLARLLTTAVRRAATPPTWTGWSCCGRARPTKPSCAPTAASPSRRWPPSSCCSTGCSPGRCSAPCPTAEDCLGELDPRSDRAGHARRVPPDPGPGPDPAGVPPDRRPPAGPPRPAGRRPGRMRRSQRGPGGPLLPPDQPDRMDPGGRRAGRRRGTGATP